MPTKHEKDTITSHLIAYGDECGFRPLIARDYGSRARGLESDRSDYDVFFIFAQPPADYALGADTETYTKTIEPEQTELDTEIELHGWNFRRFIGGDGLTGSNPTVIEFAGTDEQYYIHDKAWSQLLLEMLDHAHEQFKPYALMNHYRSLAASNYGKYIEGDYKLASDTSYDDLLSYGDPPWGGIQEDAANNLFIDEQETEIGREQIDLTGRIEWSLPCGTIDTEYALERGLIEPTTTDRTIKRHLNIAQALTKARYIEETHECPTMIFPDLLREISGSEWLPEHVYAEIGGLIAKKKSGMGESIIEHDNAMHDWIESELERDINPADHVQRQPDRGAIQGRAREIYNSISWYGIQ